VLRAAEAATAPAEGQQPESVRFANIGEQLVHRWSCDTGKLGEYCGNEEIGKKVHSQLMSPNFFYESNPFFRLKMCVLIKKENNDGKYY
jgi:hypothetical protein